MTLCISWLNRVDATATVIEADAETTDMVGANVASSLSYDIWRTLDTEAGIQFDFGSSVEIGVVAIQFPRTNDPMDYDGTTYFAEDDQVQILLSSTDANDGDVYDSGLIDSGCLAGFGTFALWLAEAETARYLRIVFNAPSRASDGFLDVSRIWAGPVFMPSIGYSYGCNQMWQSDSTSLQAARGTTTFVTPQEPYRIWSLQLDWIRDAEKNTMEDFERRMTTAGEFLIGDDLQSAGRGDMFCYLKQPTGLTATRYAISAKSFSVKENI